jgi:CHAT domain-containing protein
MQAVKKRLRRSTLDDTIERRSKLDSEPPSPVITPISLRSPRGSFSDEQIKRLRAQMRWRRAKLYAFSEINPTFNAAVAALPNSSSSIRRFREMSQSIPSDTLIIEYGLPSSAPNGLVTLLISSEGVEQAVWREANSKEIRGLIRTLRKKMSDEYAMVRRDAPSPASPNSTKSLAEYDDKTIQDLRDGLYRHLISPIEVALRVRVPQRVIVIPSGELAHVPWGMLLDVPFSIVPSLSIWHRLHQQSTSSPSAQPQIKVFSNKPKDDHGVSRDIPYSRVEALYLSWLHEQRPALADDFDRNAFEQFSRSMEILHLCAHSNFDDHDPLKSSVQLFKEPWSIKQWRELAIKAHIVIFSSCLSAISKAYDSGSTFGFAHTLLATGTRAFVGSLWPVEDEPTLLLMMLFYEELRRPRPPVDALYHAQCRLKNLTQQQLWELLELLKRMFKAIGPEEAKRYVNSPRTWLRILERYDVNRLREPRNWAAFVLTGYGFRAVYPEKGEQV